MSSFDEIDSTIDELLPETETSDKNTSDGSNLGGKFQALSSLAGHLGLYAELTNPSKEELISALYDRGIRNAAEDSVFDFLQVDDDSTKGFIRSKSGDWIEQAIDEFPTGNLAGDYREFTKVASFLGLYERYGLDGPSANKLREALVNFGVEAIPDKPNTYLASIEDGSGTTHLIGIQTGEVTTGYPVDSNGNRIGDDEYTRELLPKLVDRLENSKGDIQESPEQFAPPLPDEIDNLLENEHVAENYQLIMHRLAEQAAGENIPDAIRSKKLAEARFITEVLSGDRTWE